MKTYAIYQNIQIGSSFTCRYLGRCESEQNLSRLRGVASFRRAHDGTCAPNEVVRFSRDKAALEACKGLDSVEVDECGNCEFSI